MSSPWQKYLESLKSRSEEKDLITTNETINVLEKTDEDTSEARLLICKQCPALVNYTSQCSHCGCFMPTRVEFKTASCPLGKW